MAGMGGISVFPKDNLAGWAVFSPIFMAMPIVVLAEMRRGIVQFSFSALSPGWKSCLHQYVYDIKAISTKYKGRFYAYYSF